MIGTGWRHAASLLPQRVLGPLGWLRGSLGAGLAIAVAGLATAALLGSERSNLPWLVAPLGASAVLVFAVPASPLAQPRSVVIGNLLSASIGLIVLKNPALRSGLARA